MATTATIADRPHPRPLSRKRARGVLQLAILVAMIALACAGCSKKAPLGQVSGTVRLNGAPLANVLVVFLPDPSRGNAGPRSVAATDEQGRYSLRCDDNRDGAVLGWHRVVVEDLAPYAAPRDESAPRGSIPRSRVPPVYANAESTPLRVEVEENAQTYDIELAGK